MPFKDLMSKKRTKPVVARVLLNRLVSSDQFTRVIKRLGFVGLTYFLVRDGGLLFAYNIKR
ncbi:hypothetical protein [Aeromonas sp. 600479]|uniref:hypothetical protein n=1 Tax=Aeromonas sp. 600479 TaxID=2712028 RepID=UPI003BA0E7CB